jgi:hypothetical protein
MLQEIFGVDDEGVRFTMYLAIDVETMIYIALAIFIGIALALTFYAKVL